MYLCSFCHCYVNSSLKRWCISFLEHEAYVATVISHLCLGCVKWHYIPYIVHYPSCYSEYNLGLSQSEQRCKSTQQNSSTSHQVGSYVSLYLVCSLIMVVGGVQARMEWKEGDITNTGESCKHHLCRISTQHRTGSNKQLDGCDDGGGDIGGRVGMSVWT